jgi:hypothetical protein
VEGELGDQVEAELAGEVVWRGGGLKEAQLDVEVAGGQDVGGIGGAGTGGVGLGNLHAVRLDGGLGFVDLDGCWGRSGRGELLRRWGLVLGVGGEREEQQQNERSARL